MAEMLNSCTNSLRVNTKKFHFIWKLNGFNKVPFIAEHPIPSPSFSLEDSIDSLWQLVMAKEMRSKIKTKGTTLVFDKSGGLEEVKDAKEEIKKEKAIGFKMMKSSFFSEECESWETVSYHVQIKVGEAIFKTEEKIENGEKYYTSNTFQYIFSSDLNGVNLFDEETITIEAFIVYKKLVTRPLVPASVVNLTKFTEHVTGLFKSQKYADVILKSGDCEIAAHKSILCARSRGLEQHLCDSEECGYQQLNLDLDESVAEAFLIFAYCGKIPEEFPSEKLQDLFAAAEKFEVEELKTLVIQLKNK